MSAIKTLPVAIAFVAFTSWPAAALSSWFPHHHGNGGNDGGGAVSHSAPGPVIGVGLPAAAVIGGYIWLRRRKQKNK
jgi:hypothetical protein